ncbi:MAG: restriction endonuclease subunit S [Paludibacteraceae bacterium]|jgi:type I restriction enzyme S subunit|nr:restriction endonuclease subunit S [Paludibacteraceae bacterium]
MREGWEQNVFSNVFDLQMGKTPDRKSPEMFEGDNVWVTISDLNDKYVSESKEHISDDAASKIKIVKKGTVIMSFKLSVGKTAIASKDLYTNEAIMAFNVNEGYNINNNFLYYYLSGYNWEGGNRAVMGMTLNKATISKQIIFIPPLPTQQSIVSELDSLSKIIADCKETLKDYDALEQSIFYDMFGDPVKNDKGWEVKKLGEICTFKNGVNFSKNDKGTQYKFIGVSDFQDKKEIQARELDSILIEEKISEEYYLKDGDIVFVRSNGSKSLVGRNVLVHIQDEVVIFSGFCIRARLHDKQMTPLFLLHILKSDGIKSQISNSGRGCNISNLNQKILDSINIIAPPLPLQQSFATKIEAIEQMKAETKEALQEAETLFQARMDYWFG